jgi:20S proteasome alpha/beta subunit
MASILSVYIHNPYGVVLLYHGYGEKERAVYKMVAI